MIVGGTEAEVDADELKEGLQYCISTANLGDDLILGMPRSEIGLPAILDRMG